MDKKLDKWLAKNIMGWKLRNKSQYYQRPYGDSNYVLHVDDWFPTDNWLQVKELIDIIDNEYLADFGYSVNHHHSYGWRTHLDIRLLNDEEIYVSAKAETSELSVCRAIKKAFKKLKEYEDEREKKDKTHA